MRLSPRRQNSHDYDYDEPLQNSARGPRGPRRVGVGGPSGVDVSAIRVWVDFVSIPQANRAEQRLAITSLPAFSACCDVFVVVAPEATHADTGKTCSEATYKKRAWCRAEIFSFWARHGADDMYMLSSDGHLNQLEIKDDDLAVFGGEMTCCPVWKSTRVREASTAGRSSGRRSRTWMRNFALYIYVQLGP